VAGEIGHVPAQEHGEICRCGNRGCLETVASPAAIASLLSARSSRQVGVAELLELVERSDRGARRALADAATAVGRPGAMLVNLLNVELVVVGGDLAAAGDALLEPLQSAVDRYTVAPAAESVRVVAGTLGDRAEVMGAAGLILAKSPHALARRIGR